MLFSVTLVSFTIQAEATQSTQGLLDLLQRRLPAHSNKFEFRVQGNHTLGVTNDKYVVSQTSAGKILVQGNSLSALGIGYVVSIAILSQPVLIKT